MVRVPETSWLEQPHKIDTDMAEARRSYWELAKQRIRFRTQEEHDAFERSVFGEDAEVSSAVYIQSTGGGRFKQRRYGNVC